MPFKSAKQKKTIDAAAHNPEFAKKIGIKVSDAKKMSAHGKGQKFKEAVDTVEKDEKGNIKSWKHEGDWKKSTMKNPAGRAPNLSDKARRKTEKMSKAEKDMAENFESFINETDMVDHPKNWAPINRRLPQAAQDAEYSRRLQWYRDNQPDAFNTMQPNDMVKWKFKPGEKEIVLPSDPEGVPAKPSRPARPIKKSDATGMTGVQGTELALDGDDEMANVAEAAYSAKAGRAGKDLGKKGKNFSKIANKAGGGKKGAAIAGKVLKDIRAKHLKESIEVIQQLLAEAKKGKCNHTEEGVKCPVHGMKECTGMYESKAKCTCTDSKASHKTCEVHGKMDEALKGGQKKIAKAAPPEDKITGADFKALKSKKVKEATEEKCNHTPKGKSCPVHGMKECTGMYEGSKVDQNNDGKNNFDDVKIARMKAAAKSKKKIKESYSREELASRLFENEDDTYPDHEGRMAKAELLQIAKNAMEIFKIVKEGENLDGWISSYISVANDHLDSVAQALVYDETRDQMSIDSDDEYMESLRQHLNSLKG